MRKRFHDALFHVTAATKQRNVVYEKADGFRIDLLQQPPGPANFAFGNRFGRHDQKDLPQHFDKHFGIRAEQYGRQVEQHIFVFGCPLIQRAAQAIQALQAAPVARAETDHVDRQAVVRVWAYDLLWRQPFKKELFQTWMVVIKALEWREGVRFDDKHAGP